MGWKLWQRKKADSSITHIIKREKSRELDGYVLVEKTPVSSKAYDIAVCCSVKENQNVLIVGGARSGKTTIGEELCLKLPERKIVISFKKFLPNRRDFDIGYRWVDATQYLPNLFLDSKSVSEAFRTAFYADASSRGLMIDTILTKVGDVMAEHPKDFEEFFDVLEKQAKRGQWDESIRTLITSKMRLLQRATSGAKLVNLDFSQGNIVIDLGNVPDEEAKTFLAEYYLRQINRIEEQEQRSEKIRIVCDEVWHLLQARQQRSIIGTMLLQGAYYVNFLCITQNYTHLDEDYRSHFGTIFCFRNHNDADAIAIEKGYSALFKEAVQKLGGHEFIDLKEDANNGKISVFELRYENLVRLKIEAKVLAGQVGEDVLDPEVAPIVDKVEEKEDENLEEKAIEVLESSGVCLHGYALAKSAGVEAGDVNSRRRIVRNLVTVGKIKEWKCQTRNKEVTFYYLPETEQVHNLMMQESKKHFGDWMIVFEATHGTGKSDFIIEMNEMKIAIECETSLKKDTSDLQSRIAKNHDEGIETIIVVPINNTKEIYRQVFECKVVLIPELEEALRN